MNIQINKNNVILTDIADFRLNHVFDCGQCFRWNPQPDGSYIGVAYGRPLKISQPEETTLILHETSLADFETIWRRYFDFDRDYGVIKQTLAKDSILKKAVTCGGGIRILKQEAWETVVSFIISASNNIPRIKKIIDALCANFGNKSEYMGNIYYSFPTPETIAALTLEDLSVIRAGFRDRYILDAARKFASGDISDEKLSGLSSPDAKQCLMSIQGIGNKVADCILLFGLGRYDSFPVDVWIKRIMERCYFHTERSVSQIRAFADETFQEYGGFAQQYLFFYARENKF